MATHKANPVEVSAFRFSGQKLYELPEWVADHSVMTSMGMSGMALDGVGNLLVPTASGYKTAAYDMHLPPSSAQHFSNSLFEFYRPLDGAAFLACLDTDEERATMFKIFWGGEE